MLTVLAMLASVAWVLFPASEAGASDPTAPTVSSATYADTGVRMAFAAPSQLLGTTITGYRYESSTNGGAYAYGDFDLGSTTSPAIATSTICDGGPACTIRIEAVFDNGAVVSPWSDWTPVPAVPAPTITAATYADGGVRVAFTQSPVPAGAAITDYRYETSTNGGTNTYGDYDAGAATSPITAAITICNSDAGCSIRIAAVVGNGEWVSPWSTWKTIPVLPTPTITAATYSDTGVRVAFTQPAVPAGATITDYRYETSTNGGTDSYGDFDADTTSSPLNAAYTICASDTSTPTCAVRIEAVIGNSEWTSPWSAWTSVPYLAPPTLNSASFIDDGVRLVFTAPTVPAGATLTSYQYETSLDGGTTVYEGDLTLTPSAPTTTSPADLVNGYDYCPTADGTYACAYRIRAVIGNGQWDSAWSAWKQAAPPLSSAPSLRAASFIDGGVRLSFAAPSIPSGVSITGYQYETSLDGGTTIYEGDLTLTPNDPTTTSPADLINGYDYCPTADGTYACAYRIRAIYGAGRWQSPWSNWRIAAPALSATPSIDGASFISGGVELTFSAPSTPPGVSITGYQYETSLDGGTTVYEGDLTLTPNDPTTTSPVDLINGYDYCPAYDGSYQCAYRIRAIYGVGRWQSPWSDWETATNDHAPVATLSLSAGSGAAPFVPSIDVGGSDPDGTALTYTVDFGDGSSQSGALPAAPLTHSYSQAGAYTVRLEVSDGELKSVRTAMVNVGLSETLAAHAGDDVTGLTGAPIAFDGSASRPLIGIAGYTWDFGDGGVASGAHATHTYSGAGTYTVTLTVQAGASTDVDTLEAVVSDPPVGPGVHVHVVDDGGAPIDGADVAVIDANGTRYPGVSDASGVATLTGLADGSYTAYGWHDGYQPNTASITVAGGSAAATISLSVGSIAQTSLTATRLTYDQILAAGIDPNDPANQNVYQFEVHLAIQSGSAVQDVGIGGITNGSTLFDATFTGGTEGGPGCAPNVTCFSVDTGGGGGGSGGGGGGGGGGGPIVIYPTPINPAQPSLLWMIIPGRAKWLKEFFAIDMAVTNLAPSAFTFENGHASLGQLPAGLSLAPTAVPQSLVQDVPDIPGGTTQTVEWIVRGDTEGTYGVTADYSATLDPIGASVSLHGATPPDAIHVWGGSALHMIVDTDDSATTGYPYRVRIGLENVADIPVYNPSIELLTQGRLNYIYQPGERLAQGADVIEPGDTFWTDYYRLVPEITGTLDLSQSFVKKTAGNTDVESTIIDHAADPPSSAPRLTVSAQSDGLHVSWDAVPDATGYEVFTTPTADTLFGDTPAAVVSASQTSAVIPGDSSTFVAVSSVIAGVDTMVHPLVEASSGPSTQVASSANPSEVGQSVSFNATATSPTTPTASLNGTMKFYDGTTLLGTKAAPHGVASFATTKLALGTHQVTATFTLRNTTTPIASLALAQVVNPATTQVSVTSSASPSVFGQRVTLKATVTRLGPATGKPVGGTVTFFDDGAPFATKPAMNGSASLAIKTLSTDDHAITVSYSGSSTDQGSSSATLSQTVVAATTTVTLAATPASTVHGRTVTLTATVKVVAPSTGAVTLGSVSFYDNGTLLATVVVSNGKAKTTTTTLAPGSHTVTARYNGSVDDATSGTATGTTVVIT